MTCDKLPLMVAIRRLLIGRESEVAEAYRAGADTEDLAALFGVSRSTILRVLAVEGVDVRPRGRPATRHLVVS